VNSKSMVLQLFHLLRIQLGDDVQSWQTQMDIE